MVIASGFRPIRFGGGASPEQSKESRQADGKTSTKAEQAKAKTTSAGLQPEADSPLSFNIPPLATDRLDRSAAAYKQEASKSSEPVEETSPQTEKKRNQPVLVKFFAPGGVMHRALEAVQHFFQRIANFFQGIAERVSVHKHSAAAYESIQLSSQEHTPEKALERLDIALKESDKLAKKLKVLRPEAEHIPRTLNRFVHEEKGAIYALDLKDVDKAKAHYQKAYDIATEHPSDLFPEEWAMLEHVIQRLDSGEPLRPNDFKVHFRDQNARADKADAESPVDTTTKEMTETPAPQASKEAENKPDVSALETPTRPESSRRNVPSEADNAEKKASIGKKASVTQVQDKDE